MKIVKVLWIDSCNSNMNWTVVEDIEVEPMYINSFGVVVKDTNEFLVIAQNYGNDPEQYSNITTIPKGCIKEVFVIHEDRVCKNEQKLAWSEEDNLMEHHCHQMLALLRPNSSELTKDIIDNCHHWLKSLKDRVGCEANCATTKEWSEEDETRLTNIIIMLKEGASHHFIKDDITKAVDFLKSLRHQKYVGYNPYKATVESIAEMCKHYHIGSHSILRDFYDNVKVKCKEAIEYDEEYPQKQWKPSEEQMEALDDFIYAKYPNIEKHGAVVKSLYQDLKKLIEE